MKLTVNKDILAKNLSLVSRAVGMKPALPVLNNILLNMQHGQLKLGATNLETSIATSVAIDNAEDGSITVPARLLNEFINSLPAGEVTLQTNDENLLVTAGKYEASFAGINASEFPAIPEAKEENRTVLDKGFAKAISQTSFAASTDEGRPVLTGLLLEFKKASLGIVATDGYRLAKKTLTIESDLETTLLIPARALVEVARLIGEVDSSAEVSIQPLPENNQVSFIIGQTQVITRLLEGSFPPYQSIIPESFKTRGLVSTEEFSQAVKATALFARDLGNVVNLTLNPAEKELELRANTAQVGTGKSEITGSIEGELTTVAFNSHYLAAGLAVITTTQVTIEANDSTKAAMLKGVGDSSFFYIVMPVRLQS